MTDQESDKVIWNKYHAYYYMDTEKENIMIETQPSKTPAIPLKIEQLQKQSEEIVEISRAFYTRLLPYMPNEIAKAVREDESHKESPISFIVHMETIETNLLKAQRILTDILHLIEL